MICSRITFDDHNVCRFIENPLLLYIIKEEVDIQVSIAKAGDQDLIPTHCRKVDFRTYTRLTYGCLGRGVRHHPSQCTLDMVHCICVSSSGSHVGYHEPATAVGHGVNDLEDNISTPCLRTIHRMVQIMGLPLGARTRTRS
jgi:hypothetical protein